MDDFTALMMAHEAPDSYIRGLGPYLSSSPQTFGGGPAVLGGAEEFNFAEAMRAFLSTSAPTTDVASTALAANSGQVFLSDLVEDDPNEDDPDEVDTVEVVLVEDDRRGRDSDSDDDATLDGLVIEEAPPESGANGLDRAPSPSRVEASRATLAQFVYDEDREDAMDGLTDADFQEVEAGVVQVGADMYFQTVA